MAAPSFFFFLILILNIPISKFYAGLEKEQLYKRLAEKIQSVKEAALWK